MQPWIDGPRSALAEADVREALGLGRGAKVQHGLDVLDAHDVPTGETLRFTGGSVTYSYRPPDAVVGQQPAVSVVRRQAALELAGEVGLNLNARRFRLWTEWLLLDETWARFHLGVFIVTNPGGVSDDGTVIRRSLKLADKSYLWSSATLSDPVYVPSTTVVLDWVKADITSRFGDTVFAITSSTATLGGSGITFPSGSSVGEMYSRLLNGIGYDQLTADEEGRPASQPLAQLASKAAEITYGAGGAKIVPAGSVEPILPMLPNRLRFSARQAPGSGNTEGNGQYTVTNPSTGPASYAERGFWVDQRIDVDAFDQPTLVAFGNAEKQRYFAGGGLTFTGAVALNPRHSDRDVIDLQLPRLGATAGTWLVTSWTYPLSPVFQSEQDVLMPLTAERRVS